METEDIKRHAGFLGVKLEVPKDRDVVHATPKARVTDDLAESIRSNRDKLMRDLLMEQATRYLAQRWINAASSQVLYDAVKAVDDCPHDKPYSAYRAAVREYVKAGMTEIARAKRSSQRRAS